MIADVGVLALAAAELQQKTALEEVLQVLVERSAELLGVARVTVRLVDQEGRLLTRGRAGDALHGEREARFQVGEGLIGWVAQQKRPLRVGRASNDPRFVERPGRRAVMESFLGVPLLTARSSIGVLSTVHERPDYFAAAHEEILTVLAALGAPHVEVARLKQLTQTDALTGALNRYGLDAAFPEQVFQESATPLSVGLVDLDHFKRVNDRYGHAAGDEALRAIAALLAASVRATDAVVRYGGEEFLVVLPGVPLALAERALDRARAIIAREPLRVGAGDLRVTISAGVAERRSGESRHDLIKRADAALYDAKHSGRNRVELAR